MLCPSSGVTLSQDSHTRGGAVPLSVHWPVCCLLPRRRAILSAGTAPPVQPLSPAPHAQPVLLQLPSGERLWAFYALYCIIIVFYCLLYVLCSLVGSVRYVTVSADRCSTGALFQSQGGMKPGARGKRQTLKSASTDLGTTDMGKALSDSH